MRRKLWALRKLNAKAKDSSAKHAPVVQRSRVVRAAAVGKTAGLEQLLGKTDSGCVVDEFEVNGLNALHVASKMGHTKFVEALLEKKASPNARARGGTTQGWTPLHFAYDNGHTQLAELLVSKGVDESIKSVDGEVAKDRLEVFKRREQLRKKRYAMRSKILALQKLRTKQWKASAAKDAPVVTRSQLVRAASTGTTTEIHRLMGMETVISVVDEFEQDSGLNALHVASKMGHTKFVEALLEKKASPNARARGGTTQDWTPLHFAYKNGHSEIVKILIANGGNEFVKNSEGQVPKDLVEDVRERAATALQPLPTVVEPHPDDDASTGDVSDNLQPKLRESKFLAGFGRENDTDPVVSQVYLRRAASEGDEVQLLRLLKHCKPKAKLSRPKTGTSTTVVIPPSRGRRISQELTPNDVLPSISDPMFAIDPLDEDIAIYKDVALDIDGQDMFGFTALHEACRMNRSNIVKYLLAAGADAEVVAYQSGSMRALHCAAAFGNQEAAQLLVDHKADPDAVAEWGRTPLHFAAANGFSSVAMVLLKHGQAKVDVTDQYGRTALHLACRAGFHDVVNMLCKYGACLNPRDTFGFSALQKAARGKHLATFNIMFKFGALLIPDEENE